MAKPIKIPMQRTRDLSKAIKFARKLGNVVLFSGPGSAGAADTGRVRGARRGTTVVLNCQSRTTMHEILRMLARHFGLAPATSKSGVSSADLYELLAKRLRGGTLLLLLDGADKLTSSAFGLLRSFYNNYRLPVLLLTGEGSAHVVRRMMAKHLSWRAMQYPAADSQAQAGSGH